MNLQGLCTAAERATICHACMPACISVGCCRGMRLIYMEA